MCVGGQRVRGGHRRWGLGRGRDDGRRRVRPELVLELRGRQQQQQQQREHGLGHGGLYQVNGYPDDVVAFVNAPADNDRLILLLANLGPDPVPLPDGAQIIVASNPLTDDSRVPTDVAVWAALAPAL